jgi:hypothetical protein
VVRGRNVTMVTAMARDSGLGWTRAPVTPTTTGTRSHSDEDRARRVTRTASGTFET